MRLQDLFDNLYRPLRLRGRSSATTRLYGCLIRSFGRYLGREPMLADLDELVLARYLEARAGQVAPLTVERERCGLVALAGLAWERRLIEVKPTCPPGALPDRVPQAWSIDELRRLLSAASDPATYYKRPGRPPFFRRAPEPAADPAVYGRSIEWRALFFSALIPALWESGERIGAMLEARIEDYHRPHLVVRAEARKGRKRDRIYRLTDATCDRMESAIGGRAEGLVFVWPMARSLIYREFGKIVKAAGLDTRKRLRFHQIRRSAASHYAAAGGDAVEMLDHSSPKITKRWYLDPRLVDRGARPCDVLPPIALASAAIYPLIADENERRQAATKHDGSRPGPGRGHKTARTNSNEPFSRDHKAENARSTVGQIAAKAGTSMHAETAVATADYTTLPAGRYWVGDMAHVLGDEWEDASFECDGVPELSDGRRIAIFATSLPDATYLDDQGNEYHVESGTIGCILADDICADDARTDLGAFVMATEPFMPRRIETPASDGLFDDGVVELAGVRVQLNAEDDDQGGD